MAVEVELRVVRIRPLLGSLEKTSARSRKLREEMVDFESCRRRYYLC